MSASCLKFDSGIRNYSLTSGPDTQIKQYDMGKGSRELFLVKTKK